MSSGDGVDGPDWRPISGLLLPPWRLRLRQGPWPIFSTLRPVSNESVESNSPDELLDLISELDAFLCVMAVVAMVETDLLGLHFPGCVRILSGLGCSLTSISTWVFESLRGA